MTTPPPGHEEAPRALSPPLAPPPRPAALPLLGVPLSCTDYDEVLAWMRGMIAARERGYVCVAATHTVVACQEDPELRAAVLGSSLTVPDGQPLVWAMNALGASLSDRVYGPTLMDLACASAAKTGLRFYLYGGRNPDALAELARTLRLRHPGLQIAGGYVPPFRPLTEAEEDAVIADIERCAADVVWVGIGVPKQEKWMAQMRPRLSTPVMVGVGAAFDFHAGLIPQAPNWMQRMGLEWLFRFAQEPRRLWRRYLRYNPRFVWRFTRQWAGHAMRR